MAVESAGRGLYDVYWYMYYTLLDSIPFGCVEYRGDEPHN